MASMRVQDLPWLEDVENQVQFDYSRRAQWLRAAVLGANDGLASVASLMIAVVGVKRDMTGMFLVGFAGMVMTRACNMAIGEYISVHTQLDVVVAQKRRNNGGEDSDKEQLPNPLQASVVASLAFVAGAMVPLLGAALGGMITRECKGRLAVVGVVSSVALVGFGGLGAVLGGTTVAKPSSRALVGGWMSVAMTYGLTKLIGSGHLQM